MPDCLELGHALITMIEPEAATVADYNQWYERDHLLSGVLTGPGAYAGRRWVATRSLKALRFPHDSPIAQPVAQGSFIATYWIERDQLEAHCTWGFPEAARLASLGRMRSDRTHVSTSYYDLSGVHGRGEQPVPPELALQHPYRGLVMVWTQAVTASASHEEWADTFRRELTIAGSPIGQIVSFRPIDLPAPLPKMPGVIVGDVSARDVLAHCCFVDADVAASWLRVSTLLRTALARSSSVVPLLVAPFVPAVAGTDTYLDQLW